MMVEADEVCSWHWVSNSRHSFEPKCVPAWHPNVLQKLTGRLKKICVYIFVLGV
jgi:hypothetical protein